MRILCYTCPCHTPEGRVSMGTPTQKLMTQFCHLLGPLQEATRYRSHSWQMVSMDIITITVRMPPSVIALLSAASHSM